MDFESMGFESMDFENLNNVNQWRM